MFKWLKTRRRKQLVRQAWPDSWTEILLHNIRQYGMVPDEWKPQWHDAIQIMVAEKYWEGCDGVIIDDEIRVTIAAQAAMMLLGVDDFYFDNVRSILVYPTFQRSTLSDGLIVDEGQTLAGQAWQGGPVVLSWSDVLHGSRDASDGRNLVVHEFAHCLDGLDGEMGGNPVFNDSQTAARWREVCAREFALLAEDAAHGRFSLMDHYGATSPAEFFAVACETFFERPEPMQQQLPELFQLMVEYFHINPSDWGNHAN